MRAFWPYITPAKCFFWYLPNWTSTNLWFVVLYATYSTTHQRLVEVQFGRYQKNILQEWCRVKELSCVSYGSLKRFPHTFTTEGFLRASWGLLDGFLMGSWWVPDGFLRGSWGLPSVLSLMVYTENPLHRKSVKWRVSKFRIHTSSLSSCWLMFIIVFVCLVDILNVFCRV